jgi:hypothetical protein
MVEFTFRDDRLATITATWSSVKNSLITDSLPELPEEIPLPKTITVEKQDVGL